MYLHVTLWHKIIDLELHSKLSDSSNGDSEKRSKHIHLQAETLQWLVSQYSVLERMCAKYMTLGH